LCSVPPEAAQHKAYLDPKTARTLRSASNTLAKTRKATNPPTAPILEQPTLKNLAETPKATDPPTAQANDEFPPPSTPTFQLYLKKISMERDRAGEAPIILDRGRNGGFDFLDLSSPSKRRPVDQKDVAAVWRWCAKWYANQPVTPGPWPHPRKSLEKHVCRDFRAQLVVNARLRRLWEESKTEIPPSGGLTGLELRL